MAIYKTNNRNYFFKSLKNICYLWSKLEIYIVEISNPTNWRIIQVIYTMIMFHTYHIIKEDKLRPIRLAYMAQFFFTQLVP